MRSKMILAFMILVTNLDTAHAGFEQGYLSPQDIIRTLYYKFDKIMISEYEGSCQYMPDPREGESRNALGDINPASGEVAVPLPDSSFLSWYNPCLETYLNYASGNYTLGSVDQNAKLEQLAAKMYHPIVEKILGTCTSCSINLNARSVIRFNNLNEEEKKKYIANLVEWALGSDEEIMSYGLITDLAIFRSDLLKFANKSDSSFLDTVNRKLITILLKRDEFLQY